MAIKHRAINLHEDPTPRNFFNHLPSIATASLPAAASANEGGIVYDATTNTVKFSDGASWANIGVAGSAGSLDQSYDFGGAGAGATITVDAGAVVLASNQAAANALTITEANAANTGNMIDISNSGTGKDIDGTSSTWYVTKAGAMTVASLSSGGISDSGTAALTTLTATSATITTLSTTNHYQPAIVSAAAGNVALTIDAAGTGTITIGGTSTGAVTITPSLTLGGATTTITNGNLVLSAGTISVTAGAGDGDCLDLVPIVTQAGIDLNLATGYNLATGAVDIDTVGTGTGPVIAVNHASTYTGSVVVIDQTNAVGSTAISLTGAGTRTTPLVSITDVPTTSAPSIDLNITPGAAIQAGIDIDVAGTTAADIVTVNFSAAHTGTAFLATMANAVAGTAFEAVGSGTRTAPLVILTDTGDNGGSTIDLNSTKSHATGGVIDIDEAGTSSADIVSIDFSAAHAGDAINITMTNAAAGAQALVIDGGQTGATGEIVSISSSSAFAAGTGKLMGLTSSGNLAAATNGACLTVAETGAAQATSYAILVNSTNNESILVDTGKSRFDEEVTFKASNRNFVHPNYIAAGGGANAITGTLTDSDGANVPLADGLVVLVDLQALTLQAGVNTFNLNGGGALSIVSHYNVANNIGTAYAAQSHVQLCYNAGATCWEDMSQ